MQIGYKSELANAANWLTQLGPDINNPVSTAFIASNLPDGRLKVSNAALSPNAGGLVTWKGKPVAVPNLCYARLSTIVMIPKTSVFNVRNLETDLIQVLTPAVGGVAIPQKFNGSTRWNGDTGLFEVDASSANPAWSSIGAGPGPITPDVNHLLTILWQYDLVNLWTSVLSIAWDSSVYSVPSNLQKVGVQTSAWDKVWALQFQNSASQVGSTEVIYDKTELIFSDHPLA